MDFILMDIKNFLKKLENGQLEIEAGQWELHKDIANMRKMVNELKNLKEELGKVRMSSLQQIGLIRELQDKFEGFRTNNNEDRSYKGSGLPSEETLKEGAEVEQGDENFGKKPCRLIQSDGVLGVTPLGSKPKSDIGNEDSDLRIIGPRGVDEEEVQFAIDRMANTCSEVSENFYGNKDAKTPVKSSDDLPSLNYVASSTNQDILQRYLKDSAKYLGRKNSGSIEMAFQPSNTTACEHELPYDGCVSYDCDGCSSVIARDSDGETQDSKMKVWKEDNRRPRPLRHARSSRPARPLPKNTKKWSHKVMQRKHGKKQRIGDAAVFCKTCGKDFSNRARLNKHAVIHWMSSANPKEFKCSYCKKICSTPAKLTQHLRKCRIITRSYNRMK